MYRLIQKDTQGKEILYNIYDFEELTNLDIELGNEGMIDFSTGTIWMTNEQDRQHKINTLRGKLHFMND